MRADAASRASAPYGLHRNALDVLDLDAPDIFHFMRIHFRIFAAGFFASASLVLLSPLFAYASTGVVPSSGLVGYWMFNDGSGTNATDSSGNSNTATLVNNPSWVTGIEGSAVGFATSSTNYVSFPAGLQNTGFPTTGSLSFWVYGDFSVQTGGSVFDNVSNRNHIAVRTYASNTLQIVLEDGSGNYLNQKAQSIIGGTSTTFPVPANTWTHFVLVWDAVNGMAYVYKNGAIADSFYWGAYENSWTPNAQVFKISSAGTPFAGSTDDVALYNRVLSPAEVSTIYAGSAAPTVDVSPPSAPSSLVGTGVSTSSARLTWSAATDNVSVGGYVVYRAGTPLAYVGTTSLVYTDTGLSPNTAYPYEVYTFDSSGNRSVASSTVTVTTLSNAAPNVTPVTISSNNTSSSLAVTGNTVTLSFTSDQASLVAPTATIAGHTATVVSTGGYSWSASVTLTGGETNGPVSFSATVGNNAGVATTTVTSITSGSNVTINEVAPLVAVTAPLSAATVLGSSVTLSASSSAANGIASVQFEVDGVFVGSPILSAPYTLSWDSTSVADGSHAIVAFAQDTLGNVATSSVVSVTVHNTPPALSSGSPSGILPYNTTSTTLAATTNTAATCGYSTTPGTAYASMTPFTTTGGTSHSQTISGLTNGSSYTYYVRCQDTYALTDTNNYAISFTVAAAPYVGAVPSHGLLGYWMFNSSTGTTTDSSGNGYAATINNAPSVVSGIEGTALSFATSSGSNNNVTFPSALQNSNFPSSGSLSFWVNGAFSTQASGKCIFDCYANRNHFFISTYTGSKLSINLQDSGGNYIGANSQYVYAPGNNATSFYVPDNTWTHIVLEWDAVNKMEYVYVNGALQFSAFYGKYEATWTPSAQTFQIDNSSSGSASAEIIDDVALFNRPLTAAEISSIYSGVAAPASDTSPPSAPTNLAGVGFSPSSISLGWSPSTDNVGIGGYIIYRNGNPVGYASSTALSFVDTGLATSTGYSYQIFAFDTSGNQSVAGSNTITASTTAASLILQSTFEEDYPLNTAQIGGWAKYGPNVDADVVTTEKSRAGSKAVKFVFNYSDWQPTNTNYFQRAQISQANNITLTLGSTYWTGVSTYIPTTWQDDYPSNAELIWQYHGSTNGPACGSSPSFALYLDGNTENLNVRGATSTVYNGNTAPSSKTIGSFSLDADKGKWVDWVMKTNFSYTNGSIQVWKNGVLVANYSGPNTYHSGGCQTTDIGPWFNVGVYKWDWGNLATQVTNRTMYADEIRQADSTASCSIVNPTGALICDGPPVITPISIFSSEASTTMAKLGDAVTLSFASNQAALIPPIVTIAGHSAIALLGANNTWTASTTLAGNEGNTPLAFSVLIGNNDGLGTSTITDVTDGSSVMLDTTPPTITLNGSASDTMNVFTTYNDPGATAVDPHDGSIPVVISSSINSAVAGTYTVTYTATDAAGNSASTTRSVTVVSVASNGPVNSGGGGGGVLPISSIVPAFSFSGGGSSSTAIAAIVSKPANSSSPEATTISGGSLPPPQLFNRNLTLGSRGQDVLRLQKFLNTQGYVISANGKGSPGKETDYFGPVTRIALAKWQLANGLKDSGVFGASTRSAINASLSVSVPQTATAAPTSVARDLSSVFTRTLRFGAKGDDVKALEVYLNSHGFVIAAHGRGSPGNETNTFGSLTRLALMKFQAAHGISPASGIFGPSTRAFILGAST